MKLMTCAAKADCTGLCPRCPGREFEGLYTYLGKSTICSPGLGLVPTTNTDGAARAQIWTHLLKTRGSSYPEIRGELDRPTWDNCNLQVTRSGTFAAETRSRVSEFLDGLPKGTYLSRLFGRNALAYGPSIPENGETLYWNAKPNGSIFSMRINQ